MKAVQITEPGNITVIDIPEPVCGPEDVIIDIRYVGLCGSDLNIYRGLMPLVKYPRIPGHEISGTIMEKGEKVPSSIQKGDQVTVSPYTNCGMCPACRIGRTNTCINNQTLGVQRDGGLTERLAIHFSKVSRSDTLTLQELALVEPLSVGYHAANRGQVSEADTVLVLGCGTIGMGAIVASVRKGARVIAVDIDDSKLQRVRKFGVDHTFNSAAVDIRETIMNLTGDEGVTVAVEAAGLPATCRLAVGLTAFAGRVVFIGYSKEEVCFDTQQFVKKELNLYGSRNALHVFPAVIRMLEKRDKPFTKLISETYPFHDTCKALDHWQSNAGKISKILIDIKS